MELHGLLGVRVEPRLILRRRLPRRDALVGLVALTAILLLLRLWLDGHVELMFDEAYYALWARNIAWSYFDHPPMVALWIRLSTLLFGSGEFGVRALGTLSATAGTAVIYLLSLRLYGRRRPAIFAAFLYSAMLLIAAGAIIITPDTPLLFFWSIALYALVRIYRDGDARWWWVVGVAMGLALQSKYTALLLGAGIAWAMIIVPRLRHWWRRPAPYLAGALALAMFLPVVVWNYQHDWASFALQFGRADIDGFGFRFLPEFIGGQVGLLTPFIFVLAIAGLWLGLGIRGGRTGEASRFLVALITPLLLYFLFHSLHARVHGNWVAPAYPVVAVLAAQAAVERRWFPVRMRGAIAWSRRLAVPVGLAFIGTAYLQTAAAPIPLDPAKDPTALMAGWSDLAQEVEATARGASSAYILTSHYVLTSELTFYARGSTPIVEYNERLRWLAFGDPPPALFERPGLYVAEVDRDLSRELALRFAEVSKLGEIARTRDGRTITRYVVYVVARPTRAVLD